MTTEIKELVKRLRAKLDSLVPRAIAAMFEVRDVASAVDAIEALAGEVEQARAAAIMDNESYDTLFKRFEAAEAERDRLKGLLVPIIKEYDEACFDNFITFYLGEAVEAARKALGDAS